MDTETVSPNFDDIRPLNNSEVKDAIEKLVANEDFERALYSEEFLQKISSMVKYT